MKITLETDYCRSTVELINGGSGTVNGTEMEEMMALFKQALSGVGFSEETIKQAFNENRN